MPPGHTEGGRLDDEEYLREQYHGEGRTQADIAEEHGVTSSAVCYHMKRNGIETRASVVDDERLDDPEWLREMYVDEEMTMQQIADETGSSDGTVMNRLHEHGIPVRRNPIMGDAEDGTPDSSGTKESPSDMLSRLDPDELPS